MSNSVPRAGAQSHTSNPDLSTLKVLSLMLCPFLPHLLWKQRLLSIYRGHCQMSGLGFCWDISVVQRILQSNNNCKNNSNFFSVSHNKLLQT